MANIMLDDSVLRDFGGRTVKQVLKVGEAQRSRKVACIGDSINAGANGGSWYNIMIKRYGFEFINKGNFAVGGKTTTQIINEQLTNAINSGAEVIFVGGGTNDISNVAYSALALKTNLEYIWTTIRNAGIEVIDTSLVPVDYVDNDRRDRHATINYWRKIRCRQLGIKHVDFYEMFCGTDGEWLSGYGSDELHPSWKASHMMSERARNVMFNESFSPFLAEKDDLAHPNRPFVNAISFDIAGTPGVPAGYYTTGTGGSASIVLSHPSGLGNWARITCTSAESAALNNAEKDTSALGWSAGDKIALGMNLRWSGALGMFVIYTGSNTVAEQPLYNYSSSTSGGFFQLYHETTFVNGTNLGIRIYASGTGYFEINRPIVINLTKEGLSTS